jgi:hypothetical protein
MGMSLKDRFVAVWKDTVGSTLISAGILGGIALAFPSVRAWTTEGLARVSRLQVIGWFLLGAALGAIAVYVAIRSRLNTAKAEANKACASETDLSTCCT